MDSVLFANHVTLRPDSPARIYSWNSAQYHNNIESQDQLSSLSLSLSQKISIAAQGHIQTCFHAMHQTKEMCCGSVWPSTYVESQPKLYVQIHKYKERNSSQVVNPILPFVSLPPLSQRKLLRQLFSALPDTSRFSRPCISMIGQIQQSTVLLNSDLCSAS